MLVVPFKAGHLETIKLQERQMYLSGWVSSEQALRLEDTPAYTLMDGDTPLLTAGILPQWEDRAIAWAYLSEMGPRKFVGAHRAVKNFLDACYTKRVEMTVDVNFPEAHRWAKMLGFKMEAERMVAYSPDGRDCSLYARIL